MLANWALLFIYIWFAWSRKLDFNTAAWEDKAPWLLWPAGDLQVAGCDCSCRASSSLPHLSASSLCLISEPHPSHSVIHSSTFGLVVHPYNLWLWAMWSEPFVWWPLLWAVWWPLLWAVPFTCCQSELFSLFWLLELQNKSWGSSWFS